MVSDFEAVFGELKVLFERHTIGYQITTDTPGKYYVAISTSTSPKPIWFGGVEINRNYVSFHLMPVYCCPDLMTSCSDELRARMQGKACFNFKTVNQSLFSELEGLLIRGKDRFEKIDFSKLRQAKK